MFARAWTGLWLLTVIGAATLQLVAPGGVMAIFAGLWLVVGGTMLTARVSNSRSTLMSLRRSLRSRERPQANWETGEGELQWFLMAARYFRSGKILPAEAASQRIPDPLLRRGTQLVLDGFPREQVTIALQRQIAEDRDEFRRPIELLHGMSGYAPTLGMLGTLLGLVQMFFGLSSGNLDTVGASMGFAMLTTVYGLVLANLVFKPLASKLEQTGRRRIAQRIEQLQAVLLLYDREHSTVIREIMSSMGSRSVRPPGAVPLRPATSPL
jgi:chemotaxis protein MotA